jgi:hypothetical protein
MLTFAVPPTLTVPATGTGFSVVFPTLTVPATGTGLAVVFTTVTGAEGGAVGEVVVDVVFTCAELVTASAPINIAKAAAGRTMLDSKFLKLSLLIFLFIFPYSLF